MKNIAMIFFLICGFIMPQSHQCYEKIHHSSDTCFVQAGLDSMYDHVSINKGKAEKPFFLKKKKRIRGSEETCTPFGNQSYMDILSAELEPAPVPRNIYPFQAGTKNNKRGPPVFNLVG